MRTRPHVEQFLNKVEHLMKTHFHEKVFFPGEEMHVELEVENWREKLESVYRVVLEFVSAHQEVQCGG